MPRNKKDESPKAKPKAKAKAKPAAKLTTKPKAAAKAKAPAKPKAVKAAAKPVKPKKSTALKVSVTSKVLAKTKPVITSMIPKKNLAEKKGLLVRSEPPLVAVSTFKPLTRQGETQLIAFVRDPQCVFTYWEITPQRLDEVKKELQGEFQNSHMVLRLYEVSNGERHLIDEIRIEPGQINQYVEIKKPSGVYQLEVAQKTDSGKVVTYVTSKTVMTEIHHHSSLDASDPMGTAPGASAVGMAPGLQAYFEEMGFGDSPETITGVSSMENRQRKRSHWSSFS